MKKIMLMVAAGAMLLAMASCDKLDPSVNPNDLIPSIGGFDDNGASYSQFSVSEWHTVRFSRGNLQYQDSTSTWRFAENQYDYIGIGDTGIRSGYPGWIDLFGWGTSGATVGPSESSTSSDNYPTSMVYVNPNLDNSANDWGVRNAISNGGNEAGKWRTLSREEWDYLLFTRAGSPIGKVANARFAKATVGDVVGLILFPDTFFKPNGLAPVVNVNMIGASFSDNLYSLSQWAEFESIGAIFLPAAGFRHGKVVEQIGTQGSYWTSNYGSTGFAVSLIFNAEGIGMNSYYSYFGRSVRLVHD